MRKRRSRGRRQGVEVIGTSIGPVDAPPPRGFGTPIAADDPDDLRALARREQTRLRSIRAAHSRRRSRSRPNLPRPRGRAPRRAARCPSGPRRRPSRTTRAGPSDDPSGDPDPPGHLVRSAGRELLLGTATLLRHHHGRRTDGGHRVPGRADERPGRSHERPPLDPAVVLLPSPGLVRDRVRVSGDGFGSQEGRVSRERDRRRREREEMVRAAAPEPEEEPRT
jgi:hypothetical protein